MKTSVILFTILCFLCAPFVAYADGPTPPQPRGKVASIKEGQKAPFSGVLFDTVAAGRLHVNKLNLLGETNLEIKTALARQAALYELKLDILRAELAAEKRLRVETILIKDKEIAYLNKQLESALKPTYAEAWLAGGLVLGIALTIGTAYAVAEVR